MGYALPRPLRSTDPSFDEPASSPSARDPRTSRYSGRRLHAPRSRDAPFAHGVTPASGFDHHVPRTTPCHHGARERADLPRVCAPSALPDGGVYDCPGRCLARYVPSPGFLTLVTVCSAATPAGLFHPARALGVLPSRATAGEPERLSTPVALLTFRPPTAPAARSPRRPPRSHGSCEALRCEGRRKPTFAAFRALLPPETRTLGAVVQTAPRPEALLGFSLSRDLAHCDARGDSHHAAPLGFHEITFRTEARLAIP